MVDPELRDLVVEWVELPTPGSDHWFLHIAQTHGSGSTTEFWLTVRQAEEVLATGMRGPKPT